MEILGSYSERGDGIENEDVYGSRDNVLWIIDGATDLYHLNLFSSADDVAYYVRQLSNSIYASAIEESNLQEILKKSIAMTNEKLGLSVNCYEMYKLPNFAIMIARIKEHTCEYFVLGDCTLQVMSDGIITEITDKRIAEFSKRNREGIEKLRRDNVIDAAEEQRLLQNTRALMNTSGGYWIGSVDGKGLDHAIKGSIPVGSDVMLLGYSDGFEEAFDLFNIAEINESVFDTERLYTIAKMLRAHQSKDSDRCVTRVRKQDDLTFVLARG